jgi:hypothetical protein
MKEPPPAIAFIAPPIKDAATSQAYRASGIRV